MPRTDNNAEATDDECEIPPDVDYVLTMERLREEFISNWILAKPALDCGLEAYNFTSVLGNGAFGRVLLVRDKVSNRFYAAKELNKESVIRNKQVSHVHSEKRVLQSISFPFVVKLISSYKDVMNVYLILPYVPGGELFSYHRKLQKFTEKEARFYAAQIFLAFEYLHFMNLIYRDLKLENVLIHKDGYIKLTDFGFTKRVDTRTLTLCGTPEYMAPEIIQAKPYGTSVDWWAFGIIIYEFVKGASPFVNRKRDLMEMYGCICEGVYKMPEAFSDSLKSLVDNLLQVDTSKRFGNLISGTKPIKTHPWFSGIDWMALLGKRLPPHYVPRVLNTEELLCMEKPRDKPIQKKLPPWTKDPFKDF